MCGAIFGLISLTILPISIAQPIFCNGLVRSPPQSASVAEGWRERGRMDKHISNSDAPPVCRSEGFMPTHHSLAAQVLLALYSHVWLDEHLGRREWVSIALCFVGTVLLAVTLVPRDWRNTDIRWIQVRQRPFAAGWELSLVAA